MDNEVNTSTIVEVENVNNNTNNNVVVVREVDSSIVNFEKTKLINYFQSIKNFQETVKNLLNESEDYGKVFEGAKPSLWKSGAEKILNILNARYEIKNKEEKQEIVEIEGTKILLYDVTITVAIKKNGETIAEGVGSCNSAERKYSKDRRGNLIKDLTYYFGLKNTILKMAEKRALIDAVLHISALSNIFTQDLEEMKDNDTMMMEMIVEKDIKNEEKRLQAKAEMIKNNKEVKQEVIQNKSEKSVVDMKMEITKMINDGIITSQNLKVIEKFLFKKENWDDLNDDEKTKLYNFVTTLILRKSELPLNILRSNNELLNNSLVYNILDLNSYITLMIKARVLYTNAFEDTLRMKLEELLVKKLEDKRFKNIFESVFEKFKKNNKISSGEKIFGKDWDFINEFIKEINDIYYHKEENL